MNTKDLRFPYDRYGIWFGDIERLNDDFLAFLKFYHLDDDEIETIEYNSANAFNELCWQGKVDSGNFAHQVFDCRMSTAIKHIVEKHGFNKEAIHYEINDTYIDVWYGADIIED